MRLIVMLSAGMLVTGAIASWPVSLSAQSNCDPAYPDEGVCIPSPPPDLDCRDITYRNFTVLEPDPHHFDGDGDGVGCEPPPPGSRPHH